MVYLVTLLVVTAVGLALFIAGTVLYSHVLSVRSRGENKTIYAPPLKRFAGVYALVIITVGFVAFGIAFLSEQNSCVGITAAEAFKYYSVVCNIDVSNYKEIDGGEVKFFVSDDGEGESWYAFKRTGLFYSRYFACPSYYYYYEQNADGSVGSIAATLAEVETGGKYYYFVGLYSGSLLNSVRSDSVLVDGSFVSLEGGVAFTLDKKITSFSVDSSSTVVLG